MSSRRVLKAAEAIREVVSMAILTDLRDPRVKNVTVTFVEVSSDLRLAKIHVSVMGDEKTQKLTLKGLQNSGGYLQRKVGNRIETRYTPRLEFVLDQGIKNAMAVTRIIEDVLPNESKPSTKETASEEVSSEEVSDPSQSSDEAAGT